MTLLDGSMLEPHAWRNMPAVVVFWATWCTFCRRHNAHIDRLHRLEAGAGLRVLGVAIDGDRESLRRYMAANEFRFPVLDGMPQLREQFTQRRVIPMTCVVDRHGNLVECIAGEMSVDDVLALADIARRPRGPAT
jgi:thiol-disulfide isomerase/thioredoxin